jgi:hypothetical protein
MATVSRPLTLVPLDGDFAVCRLDRDATFPAWVFAGDFFAVTRTLDELSVVCSQALVPEGVRCEKGWRALRVAGVWDFSVVGVLSSLISPLAAAGVSVLALSTFDTDYLFMRNTDWDRALAVLRQCGHAIP